MNAIRERLGIRRATGCTLAAALVTASAFGHPFGYEEFVQTSDGTDIDVPGYSVPSFDYWNGDGLKDLIVGEGSGTATAKVRVYLNVGAVSAPEFSTYSYVQSAGEDLVVSGSGCLGIFPRVVQWDGDGKKDLLVGLSNGRVRVYLNIGTDNSPTFDAGSDLLVGEPGSQTEIDVGYRATASVVDFNGDEMKDLVVGALDGKIRVFINEGTDTEPEFHTSEILQANGGDLVIPSLRASPVIHDCEGGVQLDIVTGNTEGQLLHYSAPDYAVGDAVEAAGVPIDLSGTPRSRPFLCDWNDDELPDVLVGAGDGLIRLFPGIPIGDIDYNGVVNVQDFLQLLEHWGEAGGPGDINGDGTVDVQDFLLMLANWTPRG